MQRRPRWREEGFRLLGERDMARSCAYSPRINAGHRCFAHKRHFQQNYNLLLHARYAMQKSVVWRLKSPGPTSDLAFLILTPCQTHNGCSDCKIAWYLSCPCSRCEVAGISCRHQLLILSVKHTEGPTCGLVAIQRSTCLWRRGSVSSLCFAGFASRALSVKVNQDEKADPD